MRHCIFLMGHQRDLRRHACKLNMASVIFTGTDAIKQVIVCPAQPLPPVNVPENPLLKGFLYHLLLLLCDHGFLFIQDTFLFSVLCNSVKNFRVTKVQRILQQTVGICPLCSIGRSYQRISISIHIFPGDIPLSVHFCIFYINLLSQQMCGRMEQFPHKFRDIFCFYPGCSQTHLDLRRLQVFRLHPL